MTNNRYDYRPQPSPWNDLAKNPLYRIGPQALQSLLENMEARHVQGRGGKLLRRLFHTICCDFFTVLPQNMRLTEGDRPVPQHFTIVKYFGSRFGRGQEICPSRTILVL